MKPPLEGVRLRFFFFLASLLPLLVSPSPSILDLTYSYSKHTPGSPRLPTFELRVAKRGFNKFGTWIEMNDFFSSEHAGTHMDAPVHFVKGAQTVDRIEPKNLYRIPGVMIDVTNQTQKIANYEIKPSDIQDWIKKHGPLPDGGVVLFQTGWGRQAYNISAYSGIDRFGRLNFPGLGREAAEFLVNYNKTRIIGVGMDSISLDVGNTERYPAHIALLKAGIYGIENVANVHMLPTKGFTLTILPLKIERGSGGPARIIAEVDGRSFAEVLRSSSPGTQCHIGILYSVAAILGWHSFFFLNVRNRN